MLSVLYADKMASYAHIREKDGIPTVVNLVTWDGKAEIALPKGEKLVTMSELINMGDRYIDGKFYCESLVRKDDKGNPVWIESSLRREDEEEYNLSKP